MADLSRDNFTDEVSYASLERISPHKTHPKCEDEAIDSSKQALYSIKQQASFQTNDYKYLDNCIAKELKYVTNRNMVDLVDDVFRGEATDWPTILAQMTNTDGHTEDKYYNSVSESWDDWPVTDRRDTEAELCKYLNAVADIIRTKLGHESSQDDLVYSSQSATKGPIAKFPYARKYDLVVVPRSLQDTAQLSFADYRSAVSLESNPACSKAQSDEFLRLTEYAKFCFVHQRDRRFFIAIGFRHTTLTLFVFDRSGALVSCTYDVHKHPTDFLRIAIGVLFLDPEQLGFDTTFAKENGECLLTVEEETCKIRRNIYVDRSIRGRRSVVLKSRRNDGVYMLKYAWVDILETIEILDKEGTLHRDISLGNLVLVAVEGSKLRKGFIIDFDFANKKDRGGNEPATGKRNGNIPFMAIEILRKYADHSAIHDAESLFYVLIWIAFIQAGPNGIERRMTLAEFKMSILYSWSPPANMTDPSLSAVASIKSDLMKDELEFVNQILDRMHPYFLAIENCLLDLRRALFPPINSNLLRIVAPVRKLGEKRMRRTVAVRPARQRNEVFRQMKEALKRGMEELVELEPFLKPQISTSSTADKLCDLPSSSIGASQSYEGRRGAELQSSENVANPPEVPVPPSVAKKDVLYVQSLIRSPHNVTPSQESKKRSIVDEEDPAEEESLCSRSAKRSRGSGGSTATRRTTRSMTSANKDLN